MLSGNLSWQHPLLQMNCKNCLGNCCKTRSPNFPTDHTAASAVGSSGFFCSFAPAAGVLVKPSICTDLPNKDRGIKHWNRISALMWSCNVPVNRLAASRQHEPSCHTICNPFEWIQTCADLDSTTFALLLPFSAAGSCKCRPVEFTRSCTAWRDTTDNSAKQSGWTWSQSHTIAYTKRECLWLWEQNISRTSRALPIRSLFQETHLTALSNLVPALSTTTKQTNHRLCMIWSWFHGWESLNPCQIQKRTDFFCCQSSMRGEIQQWSEILTHGNWACNKVPAWRVHPFHLQFLGFSPRLALRTTKRSQWCTFAQWSKNLQTFINMFESETFLPKRTAFLRGSSMFSTVRTNTVVKLRFWSIWYFTWIEAGRN